MPPKAAAASGGAAAAARARSGSIVTRARSASISSVGGHGAAGSTGGLRNLKRLVQKSRARETVQQIKAKAEATNRNKAIEDAVMERMRRQRRPSVREEPPDWPNAEHMNTRYEVPQGTVQELTSLVEEIHAIERPELADAVRAIQAHRGGLGSSVGRTVGRMQLPREDELADFPRPLWRHIEACAGAVLAAFLVPQMRRRHLRHARNQRIESRRGRVPALEAATLQKIPMFRAWPASSLERLAKAATFSSYAKGEVIVYAGEPSSSTLFVASGTVAHAKKGMAAESLVLVAPKQRQGVPATGLPASAAGGGGIAAAVLGSVGQQNQAPVPPQAALDAGVLYQSAPVTCGELNVFVDEPWPSTLVAASTCDVWSLSREAVTSELANLPDVAVSATHRAVAASRNAELFKLRPFDAAAAKSGLLKGISDAFARDIAGRVEPHVFKAGEVVVREGRTADALYFIRRGRVRLSRRIMQQDTVLLTQPAPSVAGDVAIVANAAQYMTTIEALTDLDAYVLTRAAFEHTAGMYPEDMVGVQAALAQQRRDELRRNLLHLSNLVVHIPLFRDLKLPRQDVEEFLLQLQPRTYKALTSVCSQSVFADRIILVVKGQLRVGDDEIVGRNTCLGWTCTVPHRWGRGCMTMNDTCDVLEITGQAYMDFLRQRDLLQRVQDDTLKVLFPKAFPVDEVKAVAARIPKRQPRVHPVSDSVRVNLNEIRFCAVHMAELVEMRQAEAAQRHARELQTPPAFRPVSSSLWVPKRTFSPGFVVTKQFKLPTTPPPLPGTRVRL